MKEGLEEFLKRIEAKPTNETLIDRFVTLVLEEEVLERLLYLKKLVGLLLTPNPYAALKAAALELQEARKEKLTKEYEVGALKDVESCFLKLDKMDNAQLVREEINKLQSDMSREQTSARARPPITAPPKLPEFDQARGTDDDDEGMVRPPVRQARVHFRLPQFQDDEEPDDQDRTKRNVSSGYADRESSTLVKSAQSPEPMPLAFSGKTSDRESSFNPDALTYLPHQRSKSSDAASPLASQREFYDKTSDEPEEDHDASRRSSLFRASGLEVGPNLLDEPDERDQVVRPRNITSVFETNDVFSNDKATAQELKEQPIALAHQQNGEPGFSTKIAKASVEKVSTQPRAVFELSEDTGENSPSKTAFVESQHVHFPDTTADRSTTKQELRSMAPPAQVARFSASPILENTEILPDSRRLLESDGPEVTRPLNRDELIRTAMPVEAEFAAREFDRTSIELAPSKSEEASAPKSAPAAKETTTKIRDPFGPLRDTERDFFKAVKNSQREVQEPLAEVRQAPVAPAPQAPVASREAVVGKDPFAGSRESSPFGARSPHREALVPAPETFSDNLDPFSSQGIIGFPVEAQAVAKEIHVHRPAPTVQNRSSQQMPSNRPAPPGDSKWNLLRDRLRLLSGVQISRSHANDFVLRLLGERANLDEQQQVLGILLRVLDGQKQELAEQRFLAFLFEELHPKALHQLLGALKMGDQPVVFFADYLQSLVKDSQLRRTLNVIHAVIIPGLDMRWYQEAYRFLILVWPQLGLKSWHWLEEEGPMAFCDRLAEREDLFPSTLLA